MHLWAGGRCPLPGSWWMVAPSGQEWKWEGRGQAHEPESTRLPPEIEIFSDTLKIGILIYSIREWMFHLVWWWKPSCVPVNCILWHPLPLIHSEKVNICTSSVANVRLSWVGKKINYLVYLNAVVILGRAGHSAIDCPQGRLFCFWGRGEMNGYLMEHRERGWPGICIPVLCQWEWEPSAMGWSHAVCWHQQEQASLELAIPLVPPLEPGPLAESSLLSAGSRPLLPVCAWMCGCPVWLYLYKP